MNKKIAILGASYLQLPLVLKAKEMGLFVIVIAWDDENAVCKTHANEFYDISVLNKEEVLKVCLDADINAITTIATDICIPTISYVANKMNLVGNSEHTALLTTNKILMHQCLQENNIRVPLKYEFIDVDKIIKKPIKFPLIVKPADRSGSLGVKRVENESELIEAINQAIDVSFSKNCIIEEFVEGKEVSVETLSVNGHHQIIAITDKVITEFPYFVELEHHQPSSLDDEILNQITSIAINTLNATGVKNGAGHIEMKINKNDIYVIEIGSRMGGDFIGSDLVNLSTGFDYLKAVILIALGNYKQENIINKNNYSGIYFLSKQTSYLLPYFEKDYDFIVKKEIINPELNFVKSSNDRSGYLIYQSDKKMEL